MAISKDWYIKFFVEDLWFGPLSYRDASSQVRTITKEGRLDNIGYGFIATYVGDRAGDPVKDPSQLFVEEVYINGKLTLRGKTAFDYYKRLLRESVGGGP